MEPRTRMNKREMDKEPIRETVREPSRSKTKEVIGRNGKVLSRKRGNNIDKFHVPAHLIPPGWDYEWKRETILGQEDSAHMRSMSENGWTPVDASAHPGYFMADTYTGPIRRDGMLLMERPLELTKEARQEDYTAARNLMDYQRQQLGQMLPRGFDGVRPQVKQTYEPSDVSRPRLAIED